MLFNNIQIEKIYLTACQQILAHFDWHDKKLTSEIVLFPKTKSFNSYTATANATSLRSSASTQRQVTSLC